MLDVLGVSAYQRPMACGISVSGSEFEFRVLGTVQSAVARGFEFAGERAASEPPLPDVAAGS